MGCLKRGFVASFPRPVRRQFFAQPVVPQAGSSPSLFRAAAKDILFFLQEEIPEGAAVAMLTGVHPRWIRNSELRVRSGFGGVCGRRCWSSECGAPEAT